MTDYRKRIEQKIISTGNTHTTIAKKCGYTQQFISEIIYGKRNPSMMCITCIAQALGVSADWLCGINTDKCNKYHGMDYLSTGSRIKEIRKINGYTQFRAAELAGLSKTYFHHVEKDEFEPNMTTLYKIASLFNVSMDWLYSGGEK